MANEIPSINESSKINFITSIWIVPIIALFIAMWLAYQYFSALGPQITITFESNQGLKEGQSEVKFRNVPIGKVEQVLLNESGEGVKVIVRIDKEAKEYLNENAKFWIVKPEVGMGGVSGLDTIISGTYIEMVSQRDKMTKNSFVGLAQSYKELTNGEYFHLNASSSFGVEEGTPIYFKNMKVGNVQHVSISLDGKSVDVVVYIDKTYVPYVHMDTKFWIQSSVSIEYANGALNMNVAPMSHILRGGIEFSSSGEDSKAKVPRDYIFRLYRNSNIASDKKIGSGGIAFKEYYMDFNTTTAKLKLDASVRYDKFDVGRVKDIIYSYNSKTHKLNGKVVVSIDTSIFYDANEHNYTGEENFERAVKEGLKASLKEFDPISGLLYIDLAFSENNSSRYLVYSEKLPIFPTIDTSSGGIMGGVSGLIDAIKQLPIADLVESVDDVVKNLSDVVKDNKDTTKQLMLNANSILEGINKMINNKEFNNLPMELSKTMVEMQKTLQSLDSVLKSNNNESLMSSQLTQTLKELNKTSTDTQKLLKKLDKNPNSLIFGD